MGLFRTGKERGLEERMKDRGQEVGSKSGELAARGRAGRSEPWALMRELHCGRWGCCTQIPEHAGGTGGRAQHEEGRRVRKSASFLTAGRASREDEGFVRQLQETVGNMETAQMGEGAGGFLLQRDMCQTVPWPYQSTLK